MIKIKLSISDKDVENITLNYKDMTIDEIIAELKLTKTR